MISKIAIRLAVAAAAVGFAACNSSSYENVEQTASAAVVRSFTLAEDDDVMEGLDSVFFSIDLMNGRIFNADSLPVGTKVTALVPQITTLEGASLMELTVTRSGKSDTVIYYTGNAADSVDFTNPVKLRVVSPDGLTERTYRIEVNVHRMVADSLAWDTKATFALPSALAAPKAQRSACAGGNLYVLTSDGSACSMAVYSGVGALGSLYLNQAPLSVRTIAFPFTPDITSLAGTPDGTLYILDTDGHLYASADGGANWAPRGMTWVSVIGAFDGDMLGVCRSAAGAYTVQSASGRTFAMPADMPVSGFSMPVEYTFPMSYRPQLLIIGGRKADGKLTSDTWGFDGSSWAKISRRPLPEAMEGIAIAPYVVIRSTGVISTAEQKAMIAFGGRKADGTLSTVTYVSTDYGVNWRKADSTLQLPADIPAMWGAQAFVFTTTMSADIAVTSGRMRVSKPVESWECPYIYIMGARDASGAMYPTVWRGVINKLSFKPIV